ncbi:MAG: hypothetical protein AAF465_16570 [Pseudomonadota bacterium]
MRRVVLAIVLVLCGTQVFGDVGRYQARGYDGEPIIDYSRRHYRVMDSDQFLALKIYADGRVRLSTPSYMHNPGEFEFRLNAKRMQALLSSIDTMEILSFDADAAHRAKAESEARRADGERFHVSDLTETRIAIRFAHFAAPGKEGKPVNRQILWNDVAVEAERFSDVVMLQGLNHFERQLLRLTDPTRRQAVRVTGGQ